MQYLLYLIVGKFNKDGLGIKRFQGRKGANEEQLEARRLTLQKHALLWNQHIRLAVSNLSPEQGQWKLVLSYSK